LEDRELNEARSKPDTVNRPVRTARIFVHHRNSTQYCSTETVFIYIPLPPDQHHISDVANWRQRGVMSLNLKQSEVKDITFCSDMSLLSVGVTSAETQCR